MNRIFFAIYKYFKNRRLLFFAFFTAVLLAMIWHVSTLDFTEDFTSLLPSNEKSKVLKKVLNTVNFDDKIIINISAKENNREDELTAFAKTFIDSVQHNPGIPLEKIQGHIESENMIKTYTFVNAHLPLFLNTEDLETILARLKKDSIANYLQTDYKALISPAGFLTKNYIQKDPLHFTTLGLSKLKSLRPSSHFKVYQNFLFTNSGKNLLLFLTPKLDASQAEKSTIFVDNLYALIDRMNSESIDVKAKAFGSLLYSVANATQIKDDIRFTLSIALGVLLLILILFYKKIYVPILLFVPTIFGGLLALSIIAIFKGEVSLISLGIGSVLVGITLDYALHILTHLRQGASNEELFEHVTPSVLASSLTTAVAFLCLLFLKSEALIDLGLFAAISVLGSAFFALIIIPQLYKMPLTKKNSKKTLIDRIAAYPFDQNKPLLIAMGALFVLGLFYSWYVSFNSDISHLNYETKRLKTAENALAKINGEDNKSIYVVAYGRATNETLNKNNTVFKKLKQLKMDGEIDRFSNIGAVVLSKSQQKKRIHQWKQFWTPDRLQKVQTHIAAEGQNYGLKPEAFSTFYEFLNTDFKSIDLEAYENEPYLFVGDFIQKSDDDKMVTVLSTVNKKESNNKILQQAFDQTDGIMTIDRQALNETFLGRLKTNFNQLIFYSIIGVFIILLIFYRDLKLSLLTLLPIGITWIIALGLMDVLALEFNVFNIIITTFIFGLGVDYSIFITSGLQKNDISFFKGYKTSILLSFLTTLLGMGILIFAKHPALQSVALISVIGIFCAVLVSFSVQPFLFRLFVKADKKT